MFGMDAQNPADAITGETFGDRGRISYDKWRYSFVRKNQIWYLRVDLKGFPELVQELIPNIVWDGARMLRTERKPGERTACFLKYWRLPVPPTLGSISPERAFVSSDRVLYMRSSPAEDGYYGLPWVEVELK